jgi:hypothetical protein
LSAAYLTISTATATTSSNSAKFSSLLNKTLYLSNSNTTTNHHHHHHQSLGNNSIYNSTSVSLSSLNIPSKLLSKFDLNSEFKKLTLIEDNNDDVTTTTTTTATSSLHDKAASETDEPNKPNQTVPMLIKKLEKSNPSPVATATQRFETEPEQVLPVCCSSPKLKSPLDKFKSMHNKQIIGSNDSLFLNDDLTNNEISILSVFSNDLNYDEDEEDEDDDDEDDDLSFSNHNRLSSSSTSLRPGQTIDALAVTATAASNNTRPYDETRRKLRSHESKLIAARTPKNITFILRIIKICHLISKI